MGGAWTGYIIPALVLITLAAALRRRLAVFQEFVAGAGQGLRVGLRILPYVVAIYVAVGVFRSSGALDWFATAASPLLRFLALPPDLVPLLLVRPFSSAASMGLVSQVLEDHGPDSAAGYLASILQGSSETTFYVLAIYLGSVGIRRSLWAAPICLLGDLVGFVVAALLAGLALPG